MNYKKILQHLYRLESPKVKLGLENINELLSKIGNPEKNLKYIHITGTAGKGSVSSIVHQTLVKNHKKSGACPTDSL